MIRPVLVFSTIGSIVLFAGLGTARADEAETCANAYENAQRHHKSGELKASIVEAQTCARDVCPDFLKKDCASWLATWRAEDREKEQRERAAKDPPLDTKTKPPPPPNPSNASNASNASTSSAATTTDAPARPVPVMTWVLGGVGFIALAGATYFMIDGINTRHDLDKLQCAPTCDSNDVDRARTSLLVADILGVAGLIAVGGALVIYVTRPDASPRSAGVSIIPYAGGASLRTTF